MTDFDRASLDRILPSAPGSADWDDVLRRSGTGHGHRRRRLVVLAAAALVVAVGTASAFGTVRDFFLDRGFIGLPPLALRLARRRAGSSSSASTGGAPPSEACSAGSGCTPTDG